MTMKANLKSRTYRGIFKRKSREKTRQILENGSQQLDYKQFKKRETEPGVLKGKLSLFEELTWKSHGPQKKKHSQEE